ncbi:MAG: AraC family transcriptional regulator [Burkholderiales bacterium]|nr:AraC family transcriptional regulator [Burkholderiales bacterium]
MVVTRVAASYVQLLYEYLQGEGLEAERLLGPAPSLQEHFVSMPVWQAMLLKVQAIDGRPALGLRIAEKISPRHFGVVGYVALACETLADALLRLERYHASVYDANLAELHVTEHGVCVEWGVSRGKPGALVDETGIASLVQLARDLTGRYWPVREVAFVNPRPADITPYQDFFGGEVRFDQPVTRLVIDAAYLALPVRKVDPAMLADLDRQAQELLNRVSAVPAAVEAWRRALITLIREGRATLANLSAVHHTSPRSLQRRLAEHGMSFQSLLDETRFQLAKSYLLDSSLDLVEMALLLGYSEQSAFTRAFRSWTGVAPAQWRKQQLMQVTQQAA